MGATAPDFRRCLPEAFEPFVTSFDPTEQAATITLATGTARLAWRPLETRSIALMSLPRLHVRFDFGSVDETERQKVMKRFDLVMLRGGG